MGLDVSSQNGGVVCLQLVEGNIVCVDSTVIDLKKKARDTKDGLLFRRFTAMRDGLRDVQNRLPATQAWEIGVEDKLVRAGAAKGVIGSHTLAETLVAARLAAFLEFPFASISAINPRSARAGLGLNLTGDIASREETKRRVVAFVKNSFTTIRWKGDTTDEDRADACIIALSALRSALNREVTKDEKVRKHFHKCHSIDFIIDKSKPTGSDLRKSDEALTDTITDRVQGWIDDIWLRDTFPLLKTA